MKTQKVLILETNLDDWNSEGFPFLCERLFNNHALDVSLTPIHMKKGRPGFSLQVICHLQHGSAIKELILTQTSAIGLRFRTEERMTLPRNIIELDTPWGKIAAKRVKTPAGIRIYPEYEACRVVAEKHSVPLDLVYRQILKAEPEHSDG